MADRSEEGMNQETYDVLLYSGITIWLCVLLALLHVPYQPLVVVGVICVILVIWSVYREKDSGGPKNEWNE